MIVDFYLAAQADLMTKLGAALCLGTLFPHRMVLQQQPETEATGIVRLMVLMEHSTLNRLWDVGRGTLDGTQPKQTAQLRWICLERYDCTPKIMMLGLGFIEEPNFHGGTHD